MTLTRPLVCGAEVLPLWRARRGWLVGAAAFALGGVAVADDDNGGAAPKVKVERSRTKGTQSTAKCSPADPLCDFGGPGGLGLTGVGEGGGGVGEGLGLGNVPIHNPELSPTERKLHQQLRRADAASRVCLERYKLEVLSVALTVAGTGKLERCEAVGKQKGTPVAACVCAAVRRIKLPNFELARLELTHEFRAVPAK